MDAPTPYANLIRMDGAPGPIEDVRAYHAEGDIRGQEAVRFIAETIRDGSLQCTPHYAIFTDGTCTANGKWSAAETINLYAGAECEQAVRTLVEEKAHGKGALCCAGLLPPNVAMLGAPSVDAGDIKRWSTPSPDVFIELRHDQWKLKCAYDY